MVRTGLARNLPKLHTSEHYVAYLDVLGAKSFMDSNSDKFLNDLNSIYYDAMYDVMFDGLNFNKITYAKIFSDNILLAIKIEDNDEKKKKKLSRLLNYVGNIYNNALREGYLLRGGITKGAFCYNKTFVYGKALIDAVKMEDTLAIYPRIIAQKEIYEALPQYFEECADGLFALNNFIFHGLPDIYKHNLIQMYKNTQDEKVRQKINWIISFFNNYYVHSVTGTQISKEDLNNVTSS